MASRDRQLRLHFALSTESGREAEVYCRRRVNPYRVLRSAAWILRAVLRRHSRRRRRHGGRRSMLPPEPSQARCIVNDNRCIRLYGGWLVNPLRPILAPLYGSSSIDVLVSAPYCSRNDQTLGRQPHLDPIVYAPTAADFHDRLTPTLLHPPASFPSSTCAILSSRTIFTEWKSAVWWTRLSCRRDDRTLRCITLTALQTNFIRLHFESAFNCFYITVFGILVYFWI